MFYWLSKIFSYLLAPSFWILALIAWVFLTRDRMRIRRRLLITLAAVYLLMNAFLVDEAMRWWEYPMQHQAEISCPYDVAIILGGHMVSMDKQNQRRIFRAPCDRMLQGFELYQQGKVYSILLSGGPSHPLQKHEYEAIWLKDFLMLAGVPQASIMVDSSSRNTRENAVNSAKLLKDAGGKQTLLLITSATHMRRARGCFKRLGLEVVPYATDKWVGGRRYDIEHLLVPDVQSLVKWNILTHEIVGYAMYRLVGYI